MPRLIRCATRSSGGTYRLASDEVDPSRWRLEGPQSIAVAAAHHINGLELRASLDTRRYENNDAYRYVDWLLTVPLLLIELILVMSCPVRRQLR